MSAEADWLDYEDALAAVLARCRPLGAERVPLEEALGRAVAEPVLSRVDHPPWDNSAMDGFAVRADDVAGASEDDPAVLPISDDIPAGAFPGGPLRPGTAARIMTGAPVPEGATGVVRVEHTNGGREGRVTIRRDSDAGRNIRLQGEDTRRGDPLLETGDTLTPAAVGVAALGAHREVSAVRRARIGVLSGGDELAGPEELEEAVEGRRVPDSNGPALRAAVRAAGGIPLDLGLARDDPEDLRARFEAAGECDGIVSSAGVSVGERDHVRRVLGELGFERVFWRVKVRPGSALLFGLLRGRPFWGVPGNPVSATVAFEVFVAPGLRRLHGHAACRRRPVAAVLAEDVEGPTDVTTFYRVRLEEGGAGPPRATLTGPQGSGILTSMSAADALLPLPAGTSRLERGTAVGVLRLRDWWPGPGGEAAGGAA